MKRRNFIQALGLTGLAGALPLGNLQAAPEQKFFRKDARKLKGRVHSGGNGIANVAVTDGFSVVFTDRSGRYQLNAHSDAEFVYYTHPAGYEFIHTNGIPNFYAALSEKEEQLNDFELKKLSVDDGRHQFVVWADTQMISKSDAEQLKATAAPDLKKLVEGYGNNALFHGIGCGDLVWDKFELFPDYREAVQMSGVTFFNVLGNHDMDLDARTDEYSGKTFKQQFGPTYYSFNRGQIHYVVLDDVFFIGTSKKYIGYLTENQLRWLEQDLATVKPGTTVVVSLHIPTFTGAPKRNKAEETFGGTVANRKQLYKLLAPYKVHLMSGHTHFNENWEEGNLMEHNHGTVCGAWWTGPICTDGTPMGYGVYEVEGNDIKWYYKATGLPKEHQLKLYHNKTTGDLMANVWNWDAQWKVEWWEDGVAQGVMEQRVGLDPLAIEIYTGAALPTKHKWIEPTLTDHLFYAKPASGAKKLEVKVTDRFGTVYSETLQLHNA
jgi:hypothetical protein